MSKCPIWVIHVGSVCPLSGIADINSCEVDWRSSNPRRRDLARISRRGHFDPERAGTLHEAQGLGFPDELVDMRGSSCLALRNHDPVEVRGRLPAG
jgi:hypothetical protein